MGQIQEEPPLLWRFELFTERIGWGGGLFICIWTAEFAKEARMFLKTPPWHKANAWLETVALGLTLNGLY